jgi:diacylglycerol kinase family enzyme
MKIEDRYCALFGCGLVSTFLNEAYKGNKGFVQNLRVIRKAVFEAFRSVRGREGLELLAPFHCTVKGDGQKAELDDVTVLLAGTVECIGMGFRPLSRAREQQGTFHLLVNGMHPLRLLRSLNAMRRGRTVHHARHIDLVVRTLDIVAPEPFEYTMDGDMYHCDGSLRVEAGPAVPFVVI